MSTAIRKVPVRSLSVHRSASVVPEMPDDEYAALLADVRVRGVQKPLDMQPGTMTVIDGRTRLRAAKEAGLETVPVVDANLNGSDTPVAYMIRMALVRRHLTTGQKATLGVELEAEYAKQAKERQKEHGKTAPGKTRTVEANLPQVIDRRAPQARDRAAADVGVAPRTIQVAKEVKTKAPAVYEKVKAGKFTLNQAKLELKRIEYRKQEQAETKAAKVASKSSTTNGNSNWEIIQGEVGNENKSDCSLKKIEPESVRLIFCDPPYNIGFDYGEGHDDEQADDDYLAWVGRWLERSIRLLTPDGSLWVLINDEYAAEYAIALKDSGLTIRNWIIWYETFGVNCANKFNRTKRHLFYTVKDPKKPVFDVRAVSRPSDRQLKYNDARANPNGKILDDVWLDIPRLVGSAKERIPDFPTQLPLALLRRIIGCATKPGDTVLDPCSGSATTGAAAIGLGRRYVGIERSAKFAESSRARLRKVRYGALVGQGT